MLTSEKKSIQTVIEEHGKYVGPTVGVSMRPMLKTGRDTVVVLKKTERLKPLDVALYKRGDAYVLHRVLFTTDTGYVIRGDNCYADEIVPEDAVIGVLTEFFRKNKHYDCTDKRYLRYVKRRLCHYKVRRFFVKIKNGVKAVLRKPYRWIFPRKKGE